MSKVFPLQGNQMPAVDPRRTVWLSASAGTGKTQVLSARVLRLLLQPGVRPEQLLCLTFTKAGATEMALRVNEVLARWVRLDEATLGRELINIGADPAAETRRRARSLFAAVLDCPGGGLRIETIHAFSQWLLSAFPVEAGLTPGSRAMEDRDRDLLLRQVLADLLVEAEDRGDEALLAALSGLSLRLSPQQVQGFLLRCAAARDLWSGDGAWQPPLRPRINSLLGLPADDTGGSDALESLCHDDAFDCAAVRICMEINEAWGTKTGRESASIIGDWLGAPASGRLIGLETFALQFLTKAGGVRSTTNIEKKFPDYPRFAARVIECLATISERHALLALADALEPSLTLGRTFALAWEAAKAREGFVDFDDLIRLTARLLKDDGIGQWVRYKLDRSFDHILVDEAQDTNAAQWEIIDALISDFFTGEGQRGDIMRTLFVVGDYKQAIFRFQGTSPENFEAARQRVRRQLDALAAVLNDKSRELLGLGLGQSYRSSDPLLRFVDQAIEAIGWQGFGLKEVPEAHRGYDRSGLVAMWRPVSLAPGQGDDEDEPVALEDEGGETWLSRPDRMLADRLARQISGWMKTGFPLHKDGGRMATPGDVMILVRKRKDLAGLIVARLHAHGVPVAGVDRLRLGAPLAVKDLVAALRFAAQPLDDLTLANLLVSPLIGWSQEELLEHGYRSSGVRLWDHLRASEGPQTTEAMQKLRDLLARADYQTPQALLHWILVGPWLGRRRLLERLGREAADPIDELLNAAMVYSAGATPSLVGFIQWFDAGEGELKREAGKPENLVRVMTVHGSKGLQAPIVILADAADDPDRPLPRAEELVEDILGIRRKVPLPPLRKEEKARPVQEAEAQAAAEGREEHWRLLYVAMTRAEEALFIAGTLPKGKTELPVDSWFARLEPLFAHGPEIPDPLWGSRRQLGAAAPRPKVEQLLVRSGPVSEVPGWALVPVGPEPRPPRPLAPSSLGEEEAADPPFAPGPDGGAAARRGTLIHRLLERLPEIAEGMRADAAVRWLDRAAPELVPAERAEIAAAALTVLVHPHWREAFAEGSLAEVPLAATVGGRVVAGTIDRLVFSGDVIRILDFKTSRRPPQRIEDIPGAYLRQMAAYAAALRAIHPGRTVEAALLYTQTPELFVLPGELMAAQKID